MEPTAVDELYILVIVSILDISFTPCAGSLIRYASAPLSKIYAVGS